MGENLVSRPAQDSNPAGMIKAKIRLRQGRSPLMLIVVLLLVLLAPGAGTYVWQRNNKQDAASIVGRWYCTSDGMLYTFVEDGSFSAKIGDIDILTGTWQSS